MRLALPFTRIILHAGVMLAALINAAPGYCASKTVTLITGDRVTLDSSAAQSLQIAPREGRESIQFVVETLARKSGARAPVYVIPQDAAALIAAGSLDRELFNVTALEEASRDGALPMIVTYSAQARSALVMGATVSGATVTRQLESINAVALSAAEGQIKGLWDTLNAGRTAATRAVTPLRLNGAIRKIWLDRPLKRRLDRSVPQIGAPAAWAMGYQGEGVVVAVVDGAVDAAHPDLVGKVVAQKNFTREDTGPDGHGTHVASIIAGSGAASGGKYRGVAPGVTLISADVCEARSCPTSSVIDGIEWAVMEQGAKIVNLSLGELDTPDIDPLEQVVNELTEQYGTLFVAAGGNSGSGNGSMGIVDSPGTAEAALAVAAVDRADRTADLSSRGPRFDGAIKPEIAAPGVGIVAALATGVDFGLKLDDYYTAESGTSMAAPHVTGAAALLSQQRPEWGPHQLKAVLIGTAKRSLTDSVYDQGAGRVDVKAALAMQVRAAPATLGLPKALWPHDDDVPVTRTITYTNDGSTPLTLTLRVEGFGPKGVPLPQGLVTFSPATLTLAAGASAAARVTVDTRVNAQDGLYSCAIIADTGAGSLSVPLAVEREVENYDISVSHINAAGQSIASNSTFFVSTETLKEYRVPYVQGEAIVRLPVGHYVMNSVLPGSPATMFHHSRFVVNGPARLTLDARNTTAVEIQAPIENATARWLSYAAIEQLGRDQVSFVVFEPNPGKASLATQTLGERNDGLSSLLWTQWLGTGTANEQPTYSGAWVSRGALISDPTLSMPLNRSSTMQAIYSGTAPYGAPAITTAEPQILGSRIVTAVPSIPLTLPAERMEYFYANDPAVRWLTSLSAPLEAIVRADFRSAPMRLLPGHHYSSRWNEPPFSPVMPVARDSVSWAYRTGNSLMLSIPMLGDRGGHIGTVSSFGEPGFFTDTRLELFANGQQIGQATLAPEDIATLSVPPERTTYRLLANTSQSYLGFSSSVTAAWTFTSQFDSAESSTQLPLLYLRLEPKLNAQGQTHGGVPYAIPIRARQLTQAGDVALKSLSVEASFDDGKTWQRTLVKRDGLKWIALLKHPENAQYVSLRTVASDLAGNMLEQTIVRAYELTDAPTQ